MITINHWILSRIAKEGLQPYIETTYGILYSSDDANIIIGSLQVGSIKLGGDNTNIKQNINSAWETATNILKQFKYIPVGAYCGWQEINYNNDNMIKHILANNNIHVAILRPLWGRESTWGSDLYVIDNSNITPEEDYINKNLKLPETLKSPRRVMSLWKQHWNFCHNI